MNSPASTALLILAVQYQNHDEVQLFADHIASIARTSGNKIDLAVCDNGPTPSRPPDKVATFTARPDNPGYLDGGRAALAAYLDQGNALPEWIALTNTDLHFTDTNIVESLRSANSLGPTILAPRISEGEHRLEKNPHLKVARPPWRHRINRYLTYTRLTTFAYLAISAGLVHVRERRAARLQETHLAPPGEEMFSPYGALIFFNRDYILQVGLRPSVPLLAEEWAIAEDAHASKSPILFHPAIHAIHDPHKTTGPKLSKRRAAMLSRAFRYIFENQN